MPDIALAQQTATELRGGVNNELLVVQRQALSASSLTAASTETLPPIPGARPVYGSGADEQDLSLQLSPPEDVESDPVAGLITGTATTGAGAAAAAAGADEEDEDNALLRSRRARPARPLVRGPGEAEEDPFAPVGLRIGTFDLTTSLDLGIGYSMTRATAEDPGPPPTYSELKSNGTITEAGIVLLARSDWSRHALDLELAGRFPFIVGGISDDTPTIDAEAALRLDLFSDTTLTTTLGYSYASADPGSQAIVDAIDPILFPGVTADGESAVQTLSGAVVLARTVGPFIGQAETNMQRQLNADGKLTDGRSIDQGDLDFTRYGLRLRAGYQVSPVLAPFVEVEASSRVMDIRPDTGGFDRNSTGYALRAGTAFDFGPKLNGELAIGYAAENITDAALADIAGLSLQGDIGWSPRRGTDVTLGLETAIAPGTSDADSGSITYAGDLGITHRARADLELTAATGLEYEDVTGGSADTLTATAQIGATWWMNRYIGLTSRLLYEQTFSSDPAEETSSGSAFVGLKLQR